MGRYSDIAVLKISDNGILEISASDYLKEC